jgi:hypothetical protein
MMSRTEEFIEMPEKLPFICIDGILLKTNNNRKIKIKKP